MDIFGYMGNRNINLTGIFSQEQVNNIQDMTSLFKQLKHLLEKQLRVWWDIATLETYIGENMTPRRLRWDLNPNDNLNDVTLMEEWFSFFSKCEKELLGNIIKRRQLKMRTIEVNINEIRTLLLPFNSQSDYKVKERELQEHIKKYDANIQAKKQKKYKRDVLDYTNKKVYKWQIELGETSVDSDELSLDDQFSDEIIEEDTQPLNTPRRTRFENTTPSRREAIPRTPNSPSRYPGNRRDDYYGRPPMSPRYNVPTRNRYSPLGYGRQRTPWDSRNRREYPEERDFQQGRPRERPPERWNARVQYHPPSWRGTWRDSYGPRRPQRRDPLPGTYRMQRTNGHRDQFSPQHPRMNPEDGRNTNLEREPEHQFRGYERNREGNEEASRKRRREY